MSTQQAPQRKDHWTSQAYKSAAGFVPKLTTKVLSYLDAQPDDNILDIGCGDGQLTSVLAKTTSKGRILGVDSSKSFIDTAKSSYSEIENLEFLLHDATDLGSCSAAVTGKWDKAFSNAAMHWILRKESTRVTYFENVYKALKPGGTFAFEMGGKGNVAEIHAASMAALVHAGIPIEKAREASPWFFPSTQWMEKTLTDCGFEVQICELEYRPSPLSVDAGIEGWAKLMCAEFLEVVPEEKKESVLKEICDVIDPVITREEDGSKYLGYVRLRVLAKK